MAKKKRAVTACDLAVGAAYLRSLGCLRCNGTEQLCGQCADASNACRCGGADNGDLMDCSDCTVDFRLSIIRCEREIKILAKDWSMRCAEIANAVLLAGLVPGGENRYGSYLGQIHEMSPFHKRAGCPRHGWLEVPLKEGYHPAYIVDPTRWVFEHTDPYIAVIPQSDRRWREYDIGGAVFKKAILGERPKPTVASLRGKQPGGKPITVKWPKSVHRLLDEHFGCHDKLLWGQLFWLANLPLTALGDDAEAFYRAMDAAKLGQLIPIDYRQVVLKGVY